MKPKKRQKMCYNCEGEIDLDVIVCPFCAADLREEKPEQHRASYNPSISVKNLTTQQSLYPSQAQTKAIQEEEVSDEPETVSALPEEESKASVFGPVILLTLGAQLLLLGIFLFFFSNQGTLVLKWDARVWFIYIFASIPLLIFGYKTVSKL